MFVWIGWAYCAWTGAACWKAFWIGILFGIPTAVPVLAWTKLWIGEFWNGVIPVFGTHTWACHTNWVNWFWLKWGCSWMKLFTKIKIFIYLFGEILIFYLFSSCQVHLRAWLIERDRFLGHNRVQFETIWFHSYVPKCDWPIHQIQLDRILLVAYPKMIRNNIIVIT